MNEVAMFESALRAAVPARPDPRIGQALVPRLAQVARTATIEAETQASRRGTASRGGAAHSPRALVARIAIVVGLIPLVVAGLAFAGVTVPAPARHAFDSVGITLPNQPSTHSSSDSHSGPATKAPSNAGGNDVSSAAHTKAKGKGGNSTAAHQHALTQHEKAQGKAKGHSRGKAIGLNDLTPPGRSQSTGPPSHSNVGGAGDTHSNSHSSAAQLAPALQPTLPPQSGRGQSNRP